MAGNRQNWESVFGSHLSAHWHMPLERERERGTPRKPRRNRGMSHYNLKTRRNKRTTRTNKSTNRPTKQTNKPHRTKPSRLCDSFTVSSEVLASASLRALGPSKLASTIPGTAQRKPPAGNKDPHAAKNARRLLRARLFGFLSRGTKREITPHADAQGRRVTPCSG